MSLLPVVILGTPAVTAVAVGVLGGRERTRDAVSVVGAVATLVAVGTAWVSVRSGEVLTTATSIELLPGVQLGFRADGFAMVFVLLAAVLWVPAGVYATTYLREHHEGSPTRFLVWYSLCLSATFGIALAADLVTFVLFYELLTVATFPLVVHSGSDAARMAGRRYLAYLLSGGAALVLATALLVQFVGEVSFDSDRVIPADVPRAAVLVIAALCFAGLATKAAVMPLHRWLPAAMAAPTPVSALLHAVAVVKAGVFGFGRVIMFVLGAAALAGAAVTTGLAVLAAVTLVVASVVAMGQDHLKRRLAYSTIAHLSYIVLGFALVDQRAAEGAMLHLVNHGVAKITLFWVVGALLVHAGVERVSELGGIGRIMPWTMGAFAVGALSLVGLPPFGGLWSKLALVQGAFAADQLWAGLVMVLGGVLTAGYLLPVLHRAFFHPPSPQALAVTGDAHLGLRLPALAVAGVVLLLGVADPIGLYQVVSEAAAEMTGSAR